MTFQRTLETNLLKIIKANEAEAVDLNTAQLGEHGIDSEGRQLPTPYAPFTVKVKQAFGQGYGAVTGHITLFGEGDFHDSFFIDTSKFPVTFDAADSKKDKLLSEWGPVLGLTKSSEDEFSDHIKPEVKEMYRDGLRP